jgi:hypothetical protein
MKVVPDISRPKNIDTILMHWMSVKSADNLQIREHSTTAPVSYWLITKEINHGSRKVL